MLVEELFKHEDDGDEKFTYRKKETKLASSDLQEELSATILRLAKERFQKRIKKVGQLRPSIEDDVGKTDYQPGVESRATSMEPESGCEMDLEDEDDGKGKRPMRRRPKTYEPTVSTNDETSYKLLSAPVRHILSQLDTTFQILHNMRKAGLSYNSDTSDEESDSPESPKKPRGRPRLASGDAPSAEPKLKTTKRGRPKKIQIPMVGESQAGFLVRIARESHRRLPSTVDVDNKDAAFEDWLRKEDQGDGPETSNEKVEKDKKERLTRLGLRDWHDVIGAASMAGFSAEVIARTTKRCADLFGEGMMIRRLQEVPSSHGNGVQTMEYLPEPITLPVSDIDSQEEDAALETASLHMRRIASRASSLAPSHSASISPSKSPKSRPVSPNPPKSRSATPARSRSASVGQHFCPIPTCERAASGFSRKPNLKRHIVLVHGGEATEVADVDSEDEVFGAVHVDGFLRGIVPSRGWRGEDMGRRKKRRDFGVRKHEGGNDDKELPE